MTRIKKIMSLLMALIISLSIWTIAFSAFGKAIELDLDIKITSVIDGTDDLAWFTYTPIKSGVYSFLSYNVPASEAYLFTKEKQENGSKLYVQHEYAKNDPNYLENDHNNRQFCLTYHLEEGVKYYFAAGWYSSDTRTSGNMTVMLRCDSYDEDNEIERIEASTNATLTAYSGGNFQRDAQGDYYYHYNYSRIMSNMTVTVYYKDGRISTVIGEEKIDGYPIVYKEEQAVKHWYANSSQEYTANTLTVWVLDNSCAVDVLIETGNIYSVKGIVTDLSGNPVKNAKLMINSSTVATTNENGAYYFTSIPGVQKLTVKADNALAREVTITVGALSSGNDFTDNPISLYVCEYQADGIINAKDYAVMKKTLSSDELSKRSNEFILELNKTKADYDFNA